jgi:hypothetical protein
LERVAKNNILSHVFTFILCVHKIMINLKISSP